MSRPGWPWAALTLALGASACTQTPEVPILLWHSVGEGSPDADRYDVSAEEFEQQLSLLDELHATPVSLRDLVSGKPLPGRAVVLTFDDGRQCLHDVALPLLKKHRFVAEVFVVTGWTKDDPAERYRFHDNTGDHPALLWSELKAMQDSGVFQVGSHSQTHPHFAELSAEKQRAELSGSRAELKAHLPGAADFFAYPYGSLSWRSKSLAEEAGYLGAVTVEQSAGGRYGMKRYSFWRGSTDELRQTLQRIFAARP